MSVDPINYHTAFYNNLLPYHHSNFWLNLAPQELRFGGANMATQGSYVQPNLSNDALIVYDARDNAGLARCVRIPGRPVEDVAFDASKLQGVVLPSEYQLFGISNPNPLDVYATGLTNHIAAAAATHEPNPTPTTMPKPLHRVPMTRQQHYHQRHHAQAKHPQANNLKNKTRFSATGLSSNYTIVRDTKMSLSSAPSSPSAGSVGGSLGYLVSHPHMPSSAAYCIPQYKGSSSSSSCCSTTGLKISSSSMSSYSSRSSMSSTPSLSGISPRKRRADDVATNIREPYCRKDCAYRYNDGEITNLCSCEACTTDEVTSRVDGVSLRDVRTEDHGQQQKRSKNDDDVVFVSAEPGPTVRSHPKERTVRKNRKSTKKANYIRQIATVEQAIPQPRNSFPFVVPSSCAPSEQRDASPGGRYFLRSAAKGRKQDEEYALPKSATESQQAYNMATMQSVTPVSRSEYDGNNNSVMADSNVNTDEQQAPRYHTRSVQKKVNADQQKPKVQTDALIAAPPKQADNHCDVSSSTPKSANYQPASVIQSAAPSSNCNKQSYVPTSTVSSSSSSSDNAKDTPRSSSSLKKLYDIHGIIGVGGGGTVYAGTRKADGVQVAIKQVPKAKVKRWGKLNDRVVPIEFELLYRASHSGHTGVIGMLDWYERRSTYILVMERPQPVIDLFDYLNQYGALPEASARAIFRQIAEAVLHCHSNGVVHRDIKDENVLLNLHTSEAKLIDFGCGTVLKNAPYTEFAGTPEFYPPEWFTHRRYYGQRVDAWSLGVLLFTMVEAEVPFQKEKDIVECNLRHKRAAHLSDSCKNLIAWMLQKDQDLRPNIEQALNHPWFREGEAPLRISSNQKPVSNGVMGTDELYEKRLQHHQNGSHVPVKGSENQHKVASSESPESPPRYAVQEALLYQTQTTCQAPHQNVGVYQNVCVAR